jgi:hypothetical protein
LTRTALDDPRGVRGFIAPIIALGLLLGGVTAADAVAAIQPRAIAPQIDSVSPAMGGPGDRIEITGRGFSDNGSPATVTFLLTPATVSEFTDSAMTVIVPTISNPPEGFVELKVSNSAGSDIAPFRYYAAPPGEVSEPVGLKARPSKGKVTLTWSPPTQGAALVTSYQWRSQLRGAIKWSDWKTVAKGAAAGSQVVKRIRPKKVYVFQVRALAGSVTGPAATTSATGRS